MIEIHVLVGLALAGADESSFPPNLLFVSKVGASQISVFDGSEDSTLETETETDSPFGVVFGPDGLLYIADGATGRVLAFGPGGDLKKTIGEDSGLIEPRDIAFGPGGDIYVSSATGAPLTIFDAAGKFKYTIAEKHGVLRAEGVAVTPNGHIFLASQRDDVIFEFDPSGQVIDRIGVDLGLDDPIGIALGRDGNLYVASENSHEVVVFSGAGEVVARFGPEFGLELPIDLTFGPDDRLYVTALNQGLVHVFTLHELEVTAHSTLDAPGMPTFLTFSPFREKIEVSGGLTSPGNFENDYSELGMLSYAPGSTSLFITLPESNFEEGNLASVFGTNVFVFSGTEARTDASSTKRQFLGQQVPSFESTVPAATIGFRIVTTLESAGFHAVSKVKGSFDCSWKGSIFRGEARTKN